MPGAAPLSDQAKNNRLKALGFQPWTKAPPVAAAALSTAFAAPAVALDPYRGWGRHPWAHIRAQREPVVPPAGTGNEYRRPDGSPRGSLRHRPASRQETLRHRRNQLDQRNRAERGLSRNDLLASHVHNGTVRRAQRCRRWHALGFPAGCGQLATPANAAGMTQGSRGQRHLSWRPGWCTPLRDALPCRWDLHPRFLDPTMKAPCRWAARRMS